MLKYHQYHEYYEDHEDHEDQHLTVEINHRKKDKIYNMYNNISLREVTKLINRTKSEINVKFRKTC